MNRISNTVVTIFLLSSLVFAQTLGGAKRKKQESSFGSGITTSAVGGGGTGGHLAKWANNSILTDSSITENKTGLIGIGTANPTSPLTVEGMIGITLGGLKVQDGTVLPSDGGGEHHDSTL